MVEPTRYPAVNTLLADLLTRAQAILGNNLAGFYLDGSLALGDFDPASSDVDFLAAVARPLAPETFTALATMHRRVAASGRPFATELEGSYIHLAALRASPVNLSNAGQSALTVTVSDLYGNPSAGATVRLSVSDDAGDQGAIGGSDTFEGATNTNGQMKATFVKAAGGTGAVVVRAELLDGPDGEVVDETSITLFLSGAQGQMLNFLPMVRR